MKTSVLCCIFFVMAGYSAFAQPVGTRVIYWDSVGQRETITFGEKYEFFWRNASPDNCMIRYIPIPSTEKYILQVIPNQSVNSVVKVARAIYTEKTGKGTLLKDLEWQTPDTTLYWHYAGQKHCVSFDKKVNFSFSMPDLQKYYMTYAIDGDGYCVQLTGIYEVTNLHFQARCQKFIVPDPSYVSLTYDESVKREQIIWTPLLNGNWEVRMGTVEQGCISNALDQLILMQEKPEYMENLKIEKANYDPQKVKKR